MLIPPFAAFSYTPLMKPRHIWYTIPAMTQKEIELIQKAYEHNHALAKHRYDEGKAHNRTATAIVATVIDCFRGEIEGVSSPLSSLARETDAEPSRPQEPKDNGDPNPVATETMQKLGSLGIQSLEEIKGYKYDSEGHVLLHIKGRFADSGWMEKDPHLTALIAIMKTFSLPFHILERA